MDPVTIGIAAEAAAPAIAEAAPAVAGSLGIEAGAAGTGASAGAGTAAGAEGAEAAAGTETAETPNVRRSFSSRVNNTPARRPPGQEYSASDAGEESNYEDRARRPSEDAEDRETEKRIRKYLEEQDNREVRRPEKAPRKPRKRCGAVTSTILILGAAYLDILQIALDIAFEAGSVVNRFIDLIVGILAAGFLKWKGVKFSDNSKLYLSVLLSFALDFIPFIDAVTASAWVVDAIYIVITIRKEDAEYNAQFFDMKESGMSKLANKGMSMAANALNKGV